MDGPVVEGHLTKSTVKSLWEQELSVKYDIDKYPQCFTLYSKRFTTDVTEGFSRCLYNLRMEIRKLVGNQCKDIKTTFKADRVVIYAFIGIMDSNLSGLEPYS